MVPKTGHRERAKESPVGRSWFRPSSWFPHATFVERKILVVLGSASFFLASISIVFAVANLAQGRLILLASNGLNILGGVLGLIFLARGRYLAAIWPLTLCGMPATFFCALLYRNGTEINFFTFGFIVLFLMESALWRNLLLLLCAAGYLIVQAAHSAFFASGGVGSGRYITVVAIGVASVYFYSSIFRAISDAYRREVEEKNRALEAEHAALDRANAAKEKLLSLLSHDLLAPMGHVKDVVDHLHSGRVGPEQLTRVQELVKKEVDGIHALLSNLLEWSAGQGDSIAPRPERLSPSVLYSEAAEFFERIAREKRISLDNRIPPGAAVQADPRQTCAIFRNLLSNALKFTPPGGIVAAEAERDNAHWRITVRDNGIGIEPERIATLFTAPPGESTPGTANERGLGLGLRLCRDFIAAHGGTLRVHSTPGHGSAFTFTLPAAEEK